MQRVIPMVMLVVLAACGGGSYDTIDDAMAGIGCESGQIDDNPTTLFATAEGFCADGRQVALFSNTESRDNYAEVARQFGFEPIEQGDNYLVYDERV